MADTIYGANITRSCCSGDNSGICGIRNQVAIRIAAGTNNVGVLCMI
jgi:hypothetical protein